MTRFLGPLDNEGRVPPLQQTRVSSFLISAHGAQARQLGLSLPTHFRDAIDVELHAQFHHAMEIASMLAHATSWTPDPILAFLIGKWESTWLPRAADGVTDAGQALLIDLAALGHALHAVIRPAALLPENANPLDPFVLALHRIEFDSGRVIQAQMIFLKSKELFSVRDQVSAVVERRHSEVRALWFALLHGIGVSESL